MHKLETNDWWPELLQHKDELSLRELAARFGVSVQAVRAALKRNGIDRTPSPRGPRPGNKDTTDGRYRNKAHLVARYESLLGVRTDGEVAELAGVSKMTVANYRARAGIAPYRPPKGGASTEETVKAAKPAKRSKKKQRTPRASKIDAFVGLLGRVPDRAVAEKAGVTVGAVQQYRKRLGIAASGRPAEPTAASAAPRPARSAAAVGRIAWKVTLAPDDVKVVAADGLTEAAARAAALGEVVALERVGPLV